jgi:hypothetical protein
MLPTMNDTAGVLDYRRDPWAAALQCEAMAGDPRSFAVLKAFAGALEAEAALSGLSWRDAKKVAAAIASDFTHSDATEELLSRRARGIARGDDVDGWDDPSRVWRALTVAARLAGTQAYAA